MKTNFYGVTLDIFSKSEIISTLKKRFVDNEQTIVYFLNAHCFNISTKDKQYKDSLENATFILNDGIGIKIGAKFKGVSLKDNLNGTDLIPDILESLPANSKIFLLGGKEGVAKEASFNLAQKKIEVVGYLNGYFSSNDLVIKKINETKANVLIVGMGVPYQEIWIKDNIQNLRNIKLAMAGGAILDFISNNVPRAPFWLRQLKMEWVFRLIKEPKRMWKRYLLGNPLYFYKLLKN